MRKDINLKTMLGSHGIGQPTVIKKTSKNNMQKRNFILLIAFLALIVIGFLIFLYSRNAPTDENRDGGNVVSFVSEFFSFGKNRNQNGDPKTPSDISDYRDESIAEVEKMILTKVSTVPIAGYGVFTKERFIDLPTSAPSDTPQTETATTPSAPLTEFVATLRYVDKATGNILQTYADRIDERKLSDTIVLGVREALFGNKTDAVIMRYLRPDNVTIATFIGKLPADVLGGDASTTKLTGSFLPENVTDVSVSADSSKIFYLYNINDGAMGMTASVLGENKTQVLDSAFTEWLSEWPTTETIALTTKASGGAPGYMYTLGSNSKELHKALGNIYGLTTLSSPDGKLVLYGNNNLSLNIYNIETREIRSLNISTLPEKCVWSKNSTLLYCSVPKYIGQTLYPDAWYQGEVSFNDQLWKIEIENPIGIILSDPKLVGVGEEIDGIKLALSENEDYLFLINKKDSYLWELRLK
ncbi:hypothetical protein A2647_01340 [Candidatus Nomurabacteria bacterium RIFCSPHIGHO2_01_FULL_40_24b]|uniref:WD40 repeat domain-containing protein n=1 Tax=Candidatus Nomurabacteria bacterium RIFCSPHIGHO2_01_FULL_40_24b TaxID=1801739 RepID=A0A1F6V6D8_9BACT|nr:MAG: hypothetical protein A2647_01340 [Candidatus Nomurabacteria bacterium RIFCSPHIGHO2_01_FULL_40_24b]